MNQTDKQVGIEEVQSFEIDEFDYICDINLGWKKRTNSCEAASKQQMNFRDIFSDANTADLHLLLLEHVRLTSETISYPFRCDTETHCVFLRAVVSRTSSMRVGFLNKVMGYEPRPLGNRLIRKFVTVDSDFTMCSICNRLYHDEQWIEFQQLVESQVWPANGKEMRCSFDTCKNCVTSINQRMAETRRSFDSKMS